MASLDDIRRALAGGPVQRAEARRRAAVAMVIRARQGGGSEVLFIERARDERDPWSGHMAFPGGRVELADPSDRAAAERETLEEVGVDLSGAAYLGHLADLEGRHAGRPAGLAISAHVFHHEEPPPLRPNFEVAEAFWFPVGDLLRPERRAEVRPPHLEGAALPGVCVGDPERHVVWGLTYRFLQLFFERLGRGFTGA